jgi:hypothetical protein
MDERGICIGRTCWIWGITVAYQQAYALWYSVGFRNVEDLLAEPGIYISYETFHFVTDKLHLEQADAG